MNLYWGDLSPVEKRWFVDHPEHSAARNHTIPPSGLWDVGRVQDRKVNTILKAPAPEASQPEHAAYNNKKLEKYYKMLLSDIFCFRTV